MFRSVLVLSALVFVLLAPAFADDDERPIPGCVSYWNPPGAVGTTGTWSIEANITAPDCRPIHVAGMRGINPNNNTQVDLSQPDGLYHRVKQAFLNMQFVAASSGATLRDCAEVMVFVIDMVSIRPVVNRVQAELWGVPNATNPFVYPPRTILQLTGFNGLTCEIPHTNPIQYVQGAPGPNGQVVCPDPSYLPIGDILEVKGTFYIHSRPFGEFKKK